MLKNFLSNKKDELHCKMFEMLFVLIDICIFICKIVTNYPALSYIYCLKSSTLN